MSDIDKPQTAAIIAKLNDEFRSDFSKGTVVMTHGIQAEGQAFIHQAIAAVQNFSNFTEDNNPHGERDFGSFEVKGQLCFWKIDYYDLSMEAGSEDPSDPKQTKRVLTIMLAEEY